MITLIPTNFSENMESRGECNEKQKCIIMSYDNYYLLICHLAAAHNKTALSCVYSNTQFL